MEITKKVGPSLTRNTIDKTTMKESPVEKTVHEVVNKAQRRGRFFTRIDDRRRNDMHRKTETKIWKV
jgi:hypothetical protein